MFWKVSEVGSNTKKRLGVRPGWKCGYSFQQGNVLTSRLSSALGLVSKGHRCEHKSSLSCPHVRDNLFLCHVVLSWSPIRPLPCPYGFQLMLSWLRIFLQSRDECSPLWFSNAWFISITVPSESGPLNRVGAFGVCGPFSLYLQRFCSSQTLVYTDAAGNVSEVRPGAEGAMEAAVLAWPSQ